MGDATVVPLSAAEVLQAGDAHDHDLEQKVLDLANLEVSTRLLLAPLDTDKDGKIQLRELLEATRLFEEQKHIKQDRIPLSMFTEKVRKKMDCFDSDGDNTIGTAELERAAELYAAEKKNASRLWKLVVVLCVSGLLMLGAITGLTFAVVELSKETSVSGGVLTVKGEPDQAVKVDAVHGHNLDMTTHTEQIVPTGALPEELATRRHLLGIAQQRAHPRRNLMGAEEGEAEHLVDVSASDELLLMAVRSCMLGSCAPQTFTFYGEISRVSVSTIERGSYASDPLADGTFEAALVLACQTNVLVCNATDYEEDDCANVKEHCETYEVDCPHKANNTGGDVCAVFVKSPAEDEPSARRRSRALLQDHGRTLLDEDFKREFIRNKLGDKRKYKGGKGHYVPGDCYNYMKVEHYTQWVDGYSDSLHELLDNPDHPFYEEEDIKEAYRGYPPWIEAYGTSGKKKWREHCEDVSIKASDHPDGPYGSFRVNTLPPPGKAYMRDYYSYWFYDYSKCFPADGMVVLDTGARKRMAELRVGDNVQAVNARTGEVVFSRVYAFGHHDAHGSARYAEVTLRPATASEGDGIVTRLSANHLTRRCARVADTACEAWEDVAAHEVRPGDLLATAGGGAGVDGHSTGLAAVVEVKPVKLAGVFGPRTHASTIVVDGVVHSVYTQENLRGQRLAMWPLRILDRVAPAWSASTANAQLDAYSHDEFGSRYLAFLARTFGYANK